VVTPAAMAMGAAPPILDPELALARSVVRL
jgi:hypothetical protein